MSPQPIAKQQIDGDLKLENEESSFLNFFGTYIIQKIFIQLSNSYFYEDIQDIEDCYSDCISFSLTSKLFNSISKQTQFSFKIFQNQKIENINFNTYLKLNYISQHEYIKDINFIAKEDILHEIIVRAALDGFCSLVETLILNGANPNYDKKMQEHPHRFIYSPLDRSCLRGHYKTAKLLISKNANINYRGFDDDSLLHPACESNNLKLVKYLLSKGLDINDLDDTGDPPIVKAFNKDLNLDLVKYLVENGADLHLQTRVGQTLLFEAVDQGTIEVVDCLISSGLSVNQRDKRGNTVLYWSVRFGEPSMISFLISKGADLTFKYEDNDNILEVAKKQLAKNEITIDVVQELEKYF